MIPSKHSPAPWSAEFGDSSHRFVLVKDGDDRTVFYKYCSGSAEKADQDAANARLIAAAPELLEALEAIRVAVCYAAPPKEYGTPDDPNPGYEARVPVAFVEQIDAAIAKATGSSDFHITERRA